MTSTRTDAGTAAGAATTAGAAEAWEGGTLSAAQRDELGLTDAELSLVRGYLGRPATWTELGIFAVMWSEHCSYKSSKKLLRTLPTEGPLVLQGPGEQAGVIALDETWAIAFKIESHNHPSAIEPYQGAATGVGGILRDIFAMGARPIALMNSLHFGRPDDPDPARADRTRHLVRGVVSGIADYGNCVGIPTVGGETHFHPSYHGNPLVNVMAVGLVRRDGIVRSAASTPGARVLYYGNATGRDGIHGATFSSDTFAGDGDDQRGAVQVGDPFMEKKILEATLELIASGAIEAIQDMGAAGLTCSTSEMAGRGGTGIDVNLDLVPRRAKGLSPYEIMLSESQERMLATVLPKNWEKAKKVLEKWDLEVVDLGSITDDGIMRVTGHVPGAPERDGEPTGVHVCAPVTVLTGTAPEYDLPAREPADRAALFVLDAADLAPPDNAGKALLGLLASPLTARRNWIREQYDTMVGTNTALHTLGGDAAVLRIEGSNAGIAIALDSSARAGFVDPRRGAMLSIAEAARNVACTGASPAAVTNNLNFGDPRNPEIFWQMEESVAGMGEACRALGTPVTGGNVSLYNETDGTAILPTLTIGMLGIHPAPAKAVGIAAQSGRLVLVGSGRPSLATSTWLLHSRDRIAGRPDAPDLEDEKKLHAFLAAGVAAGEILAAHDVADGGIAVALAEMAAAGRIGIDVTVPDSPHGLTTALFGEGPGRVLVCIPENGLEAARARAARLALRFTEIGKADGDRFQLRPWIDLPVQDIIDAGRNTFGELFNVIR